MSNIYPESLNGLSNTSNECEEDINSDTRGYSVNNNTRGYNINNSTFNNTKSDNHLNGMYPTFAQSSVGNDMFSNSNCESNANLTHFSDYFNNTLNLSSQTEQSQYPSNQQAPSSAGYNSLFNEFSNRSPSLNAKMQNSPQSPFASSPLAKPAHGPSYASSRNSNSSFIPFSLSSSNSSYTPEPSVGLSFNNSTFRANSFHLSYELQGGVSNINSRRPSYAAEVFNRERESKFSFSSGHLKSDNESIGENIALSTIASSLGSNELSLDTGLYGAYKEPRSYGGSYHSANNSPLASRFNNGSYNVGNPPHSAMAGSFNMVPESPFEKSSFFPSDAPTAISLDNGLLLVNNHIITSPELRALYKKANNYFCIETAEKVYNGLKALLDPMVAHAGKVANLVNFLKRKNDIGNSSNAKFKLLCLVCSKAGKIDVLTVSSNSNILLQKHDMVVVEGDRGKDLVHIIEPTVGLNFVVLLNFLKKREHLKSMGGIIPDQKKPSNATTTANYVQDDENVISLPTKQILRFASAQEVNQLPIKLKSEIIAFKIALEKLNQINMKCLSSGKKYNSGKGPLNLKIFNSEYQFDKKKLIFYYSCDKRNDFRDLIKELFKIYKTRIWLCAVLNPDEFNPYNEANISSRKNLESALKEFNSQPPPPNLFGSRKLSTAGSDFNPQLFNPSLSNSSENNIFSNPSLEDYSLANSYKIDDRKSSVTSNNQARYHSASSSIDDTSDPNVATLTSSPVLSVSSQASAADDKSTRSSVASETLTAGQTSPGLNAKQASLNFDQQREQLLKNKYQERINKILCLDENNFDLENVVVDDFHALNLLNSIENLKIDLNLN